MNALSRLPLVAHVAEDSVLKSPALSQLTPFVVRGRRRYATCSGVSWFDRDHIAVVNLYGGHLRIYRVERVSDEPVGLVLIHEFSEGVCYPEDVAVSPDGRLVAITHSMTKDRGLTLHSLDRETLRPSPAVEVLRKGIAYHGVSFSPDSRFLAVTDVGWDRQGFVEVISVSERPYSQVCLLASPHRGLQPKGIAFSRDSQFAFVAYSPNVRERYTANEPAGVLAAYRFDRITGAIGRQLDQIRGAPDSLGAPEICAATPPNVRGEISIFAADQGFDNVSEFLFDPQTETLREAGNFVRGLPFPHGVDVSPDGRYVAATSYGNDTLLIFRREEIP